MAGRSRRLAASLLVAACLAVALFGCGSSSSGASDAGVPDAQVCEDGDGDGYGNGDGCRGPDCRDDDATVHDCGCDDDPTRAGCPCDGSEQTRPCFDGPAGAEAIGICASGVRECRAGTWSACEGQVLPQVEDCNYDDDDCDGVVDDGVQGDCGDCDPLCELLHFGRDGELFPSSDGVRADDDRSVTLDEGSSEAQLTILFDETEHHKCPYAYGPVDVGAEIPPGAAVTVEFRREDGLETLAAEAWRNVLLLPGGVSPSDLYERGEDKRWLFVELRITLTAAPDGASPVLEWMTMGRRYISCTFE